MFFVNSYRNRRDLRLTGSTWSTCLVSGQCKVGCIQPLNLTLGHSSHLSSYVILSLIVKFPIHFYRIYDYIQYVNGCDRVIGFLM